MINRNKNTCNEEAIGDGISEEMRMLIDRFAKPRRERLSEFFKQYGNDTLEYLLAEYEYESGALHPPHNQKKPITTLRIGKK